MSVVATIRPACDGLFGPCVAVEEGTTNLIYNVSGVDPDFEQDSNGDGLADGWIAGIHGTGDSGRTFVCSLVDGVHGGKAQRVEITASSNTNDSNINHYSAGKIPVSANTTYTASVYLRGRSSPLYIRIYEIDAAGTTLVTSVGSNVQADGQWHRAELTFTTTADTATVVCYVTFGSDVGDWIEVDKYQLEQKSFATSFVDGSRGSPNLRYSLHDVLGEIKDWTVAFWVRPQGLAANGRPMYWVVGQYEATPTGAYHYFGLNINALPASFAWTAIDVGASAAIQGTTQLTSFGDWFFFALVFDRTNNIRRLFVNGQQEATGDISAFPQTLAAPSYPYMHIGSLPAGTYEGNALFSNLLTVPAAIDAATIKEWYDLQKPFFDPAPRIVVPRPSGVTLNVA